MTDGGRLPSAIAADGLLNIPHRSCERLEGELEVLEPRTGVTELRECACACAYTFGSAEKIVRKRQFSISSLSTSTICPLSTSGNVYCSFILKALII